MDSENIKIIDHYCQMHLKVIIAWGNHPKGLFDEYQVIKKKVMGLLTQNHNKVFYVNRFSLEGNPKHGQIWSYKDELKEFSSLKKTNDKQVKSN